MQQHIKKLGRRLLQIDWILFSSALIIAMAGLVTINSFVGEQNLYNKQVMWILVSVLTFFVLSLVDFRFLRRTNVIMSLYIIIAVLLLVLIISGPVIRGITGWFDFGAFSVQPAELAKLVVILLLSKYFTRRHTEIAQIRHILVSGLYAFILFALVFVQPDFGSALVIFLIWLGMVLVSGISKKHLLGVFLIGIVSFFIIWSFIFQDYQKTRIASFLDPYTDLQGAGYNTYQSTIAVGSGDLLGKGIGYGTQSRLQFLPEYETDFIFAAFAEEWGFVGVMTLFVVFGILFWRILATALKGAGNFEILFALGLSIMFMSHIIIHVGMNIGVLPVTGITLPFMSYGGSHLMAEFIGLGILSGMRRYERVTHKEGLLNEVVGVN